MNIVCVKYNNSQEALIIGFGEYSMKTLSLSSPNLFSFYCEGLIDTPCRLLTTGGIMDQRPQLFGNPPSC